MAEGESFGEVEYTLALPCGREIASSAAGAWDVHVRWKGWRPAHVARAEPGWMRRVAAHNGGSLAE
jgi:hypothetical protein